MSREIGQKREREVIHVRDEGMKCMEMAGRYQAS